LIAAAREVENDELAVAKVEETKFSLKKRELKNQKYASSFLTRVVIMHAHAVI
jgi:hypothetical protein